MVGAPLNMLDAAVLAILCLSAIVAFFRGFVREILSLGAWVGAAVVTLYLYPHSVDFLKHHVHTKNEHVIGAGSAIGTYIVALIAISILNSIIIRYVKTGMEVGILDNFLGLLFGALRGVFIVSLGYLIIGTAVPKENPPEWIKTSFTKDYLQKGADTLVSIAPEYLGDIEGMVKNQVQKDEEETADPNANDNGYKPQSQKEFDRLLDTTQKR